MICEVCSKFKATVHLTEIINDQVTKLHICEQCAKKKGTQMEQHFGIADLLQGLADHGEKLPETSVQKLKCADCGMTFDEFKKIGRLGCSRCYAAFEPNLLPLLKRIHSSDRHTGKRPGDSPVKPGSKTAAQRGTEAADGLQELKARLKEAVEKENYEEAVYLRDKIRKFESKRKTKDAG